MKTSVQKNDPIPSNNKSKSPSIGRQFAWISAGRIVAALVQAILFIFLARQAGPALFGLFSTVYGTVIVIQAIFDLGISSLVIRERAIDKSNPIAASALKVVDKTSVILLVFSAAIVTLLSIYFDSTFLTLLPLAVWVASERHVETWLGVRLADGDAHVNTWTLIFRRLGSLILYLVLTILGCSPLLAFSLSTALTSLVAAIVIRQNTLQFLDKNPEKKSILFIVSLSWPFWINSLGIQLRNLDTLIVATFGGQIAAGFYAAASRITGPLRILSTSLATVLLPHASSGQGRHIRDLARPLAILVSALTVMYAGVLILVPWIIPIALGNSYHDAILPIQIVVGGLIFASMVSLLNSLLQGAGKQRSVAVVSVMTTFICLILVGFLSYEYQATGAAIGLSVSFVSQFFVLMGVWLSHIRAKRLVSSESRSIGNS